MTDDSHDGDEPVDREHAGDVPDFVSIRDKIVDELVRFIQELRRAGVAVPADAAQTAGRALVEVGFQRDDAQAALRASLVTCKEDIDTYDRLFETFWQRLTASLDAEGLGDRVDENEPGSDEVPLGVESVEVEYPDPEPTDDEASDTRETATIQARGGDVEASASDDEAMRSTYSRHGSPSRVEAASVLTSDDDHLAPAMRRLTRTLLTVKGRRYTREGQGPIDARRTLRESLSTGGVVLDVPRTEREPTSVHATLLVDVSRSVLDVLDRGVLIEFLRLARATWGATIFFFDEDLWEVSGAFDGQEAGDALAALEDAEANWGGGTRIGFALDTVQREHRRTVDRDTVVFVISDGLEKGEIDDLAVGMAWLSRQAAAVLWLNPLAAAPEYEPLARGMETALPYVDGLFAFAGADDLDEIARQIQLWGLHGSIGYDLNDR
jgi:uncharacterized protein with von Willebrand factor type A (vWA) domain